MAFGLARQRGKLVSELFDLRLQLQNLLFGDVGLRLGLLRHVDAGQPGLIALLAQRGQALIVVYFLLQQLLERQIALQLVVGGRHRAGQRQRRLFLLGARGVDLRLGGVHLVAVFAPPVELVRQVQPQRVGAFVDRLMRIPQPHIDVLRHALALGAGVQIRFGRWRRWLHPPRSVLRARGRRLDAGSASFAASASSGYPTADP